MLIPKHCSNPKCHRPYQAQDGTDQYGEALVKLDCEPTIRVVSVCKECRKDFNLKMAKETMAEVMPVVIDGILNDAKITNMERLARVENFSHYRIKAVGRDIDELNKNLCG